MKTDAAVLLDLLEEMKFTIPVSQETVYKSLAAFNDSQGDDFNAIVVVNSCCGRLRKFVELIPNTTAIHQSSFMEAIKNFEHHFRLRNMGITWQQFLAAIQQPTHTQALHFLDYMIQSQEFWRTRSVDIKDATELLDALDELISHLQVPDYVKGMLRNDISKLRTVLGNYEKFGEQDYWDKFQKLTGLFGSIYTTLDDDARTQAEPLVRRMIAKVTGGLSVSADVAQLATTAFAMLPRA